MNFLSQNAANPFTAVRLSGIIAEHPPGLVVFFFSYIQRRDAQ